MEPIEKAVLDERKWILFAKKVVARKSFKAGKKKVQKQNKNNTGLR